jgi:hypothetical protein
MIKKLILIGIILVMILSLTACKGGYKIINYESVDGLQTAYPNYYYFDFDIEGIDVQNCSLDGFNKRVEKPLKGSPKWELRVHAYFIDYTVVEFTNLLINTDIQVSGGLKQIDGLTLGNKYGNLISEMTIDNVECFIYYKISNYGKDNMIISQRHYIDVWLNLEDKSYNIKFGFLIPVEQKLDEMNDEYFLNLCLPDITSAITNRHKVK